MKQTGVDFLTQQAHSNTDLMGEWFKTWALNNEETAKDLMNELHTKPNGGFTCYIKNFRKGLEHHSDDFSSQIAQRVEQALVDSLRQAHQESLELSNCVRLLNENPLHPDVALRLRQDIQEMLRTVADLKLK